MKRYLTTDAVKDTYQFPSEGAVRKFLAYHQHELVVLKRGRVLLVEEAEIDAFLKRSRRHAIRRRAHARVA